MNRQIVLDTETTGMEVEQGHRIIEIGCVELHARRPTGRDFHRYLNPERAIDAGAQDVHGIELRELADKPRFADIARELIEYLRGAELIIHNAPFDVGFLDRELAHSGCSERIADVARVTDSLLLARRLHPGQRNSLDALCRRYQISTASRELHGALLDARLLAEVYLAMTGGQAALGLETTAEAEDADNDTLRRLASSLGALRPALVVSKPDVEEMAAHHARLYEIAAKAGTCLWVSDLTDT
ncbi:MAG: DNA polymerase III subunit epsilon [Gammaproteobacteria bacterium]|nr:DNA polymerase III subunit epsilon [Gammaproteobacteria bacterium]